MAFSAKVGITVPPFFTARSPKGSHNSSSVAEWIPQLYSKCFDLASKLIITTVSATITSLYSNPAETVPRPVPMNNVSEKQIKQLSQKQSLQSAARAKRRSRWRLWDPFCDREWDVLQYNTREARGGPNLHLCRILCLLWFELCPKTESVNEEKQIFSSTVQTHKSILHLSSSPKPHLKLSALLYQSDSRIEICRLRNWGILALTSVVACY